MRGFRQLSLVQKSSVLHMVDTDIMTQFLRDSPNLTIMDLNKNIPEGVLINSNDIGNC